MPYLRTPPAWWSASYTVTSQPALAMSAAHAIPAGPEPTIPMRKAVGSMLGTRNHFSAIAWSPTHRSSRPIATGSSEAPTTHGPSHWFSCGHTRPQIAGSKLVSVITW